MTAKRRTGWTAAVWALWFLAAAASAQGPHRGPGRDMDDGSPRRMAPAEQQRPDQASSRETEPQGSGSAHRLSPEERRQLRRDVHEAGRDLYPVRMPSGRREMRRE